VVALDLDGTILPRDLELSPFTVRTLAAMNEAGVTIIIATGRMYQSALRYARALDLTGALIAYEGAMVKDIASGEVLLHKPIPVELAREVLLPLEAEHRSINVYIDDVLYVKEWTDDVRRYQRISQVEVHAVGTLSAFLAQPTTKIVVTGEPGLLDRLQEHLVAVFAERLYIAKSLPFFLEIAAPDVSKSRALAFLGERLGFTAQDVIAFGDSYNDVDMLEWAGLGVAMANAPDAVRAAADAVCPSVDDDGVARFLLRPAGEGPYR
jgi:Cof subfamily protein (haloacid dehalogenase superfamily)